MCTFNATDRMNIMKMDLTVTGYENVTVGRGAMLFSPRRRMLIACLLSLVLRLCQFKRMKHEFKMDLWTRNKQVIEVFNEHGNVGALNSG